MDRLDRIEAILQNPAIPELIEFYNKNEKILAPFQFIHDNEVDLTTEHVDEIFELPDLEINTTPVDPKLLKELADIIEETRNVSLKLIHYHALNYRLVSMYNQFILKKQIDNK